jgi:hypothetical protein
VNLQVSAAQKNIGYFQTHITVRSCLDFSSVYKRQDPGVDGRIILKTGNVCIT